jgi:hypothetical protein
MEEVERNEAGEPIGPAIVDAAIDATILDEPGGGSRVSWSAVLAGTVVMLALSAILWVLALAIVSLVTHPTGDSIRGSGMALWISAIATTVIGGFVGGIVAGFVPRFGRAPSLHGFVAWGLAMLLALGFDLATMRGSVEATAAAVADTIGAERMVAPSNPGGQATPGVAIGSDGQHRINPRSDYRGDQGATLMQPQFQPQAPAARAGAYGGGRTALESLIGTSATASWSWFIAWLLAGILAVVGANIGARASRPRLFEAGLLREEEMQGGGGGRPLTPAHNV